MRFANGFLVAVGAVALVTLVNGFFSYQLLGFSLVSIVYYFAFPAAGATIGFGALLLPPRRRALVAINVAAALVAVAVAGALMPRWLPDARGTLDGRGETSRSRVSEALRLRDEGVPAFPAFSPANVVAQPFRSDNGDLALRPEFRLDGEPVIPFASLPGQRTVLCRETADFVVYETDEVGFANPPGIWDGRPIDVAVLGDSYVHGHCVSEPLSLVGKLRERFPNVMNLGVEATGPLAQLAIEREYATVIRPRVLVWVYFENDLYDLEVERRIPLYREYLEPSFSQHLRERGSDVATLLEGWMDENLRARREGVPALRAPSSPSRRLHLAIHPAPLRAAVARLHSHAIADFDAFERVLARARDDAAAWDGRMIFVYLPSWTYFYGNVGLADGYRRRNRERVLEIARRLGLPVVDLLPAFRAHDEPKRLSLGRNLHYSPEGYALTAAVIADSVSAMLKREDPGRGD